MYQFAIFDLDGTLLDTLDDLAYAVNAALSAHGKPTRTRDEVRSFVGDGVALLVERALPDGRHYPAFDACLADFKRVYAENSRVRTRPYEGIPALLAHLHERGIRVAVVSNKFDAAVRELCVSTTTGTGALPSPLDFWEAAEMETPCFPRAVATMPNTPGRSASMKRR